MITFQGSEQHMDAAAFAAWTGWRSRSTPCVDVVVKRARYFRNASIRHYLIVVPPGPVVGHHRCVGERIEATSHDAGVIQLDPPGLVLDVTHLFATPAP